MSTWYRQQGGGISGPFSMEELEFLRNRKKLSPSDLVREGQAGEWISAAAVDGLFPRVRSVSSSSKNVLAANSSSYGGSATAMLVEPLSLAGATGDEASSQPGTDSPDAPQRGNPRLSPPPLTSADQARNEKRKRILTGIAIGIGIVLLILLLLWLLLMFAGTPGAGGGSGGGSGNGRGAGAGSGDGSSGGDRSAARGSSSRAPADAKVASASPIRFEGPVDPDETALIGMKPATPAARTGGDPSGRLGSGGAGGGGGGTEGSSFFGVKSKGRKVVYIVDCSSSMDGAPFQKACQELADSISRLKSSQSFYVFFFDNKAHPMLGSERAMLKATPENVGKVQQWIKRFRGGGGTVPREALMESLELRPDVIYLLTDGLFNAGVVDEVRNRNDGRTSINTIGFMNRSGEPLLVRIANENRGDYRFVP